MQIANIGQLRQLLDEMEAKWTVTDEEILGNFNAQPVCTPYFTVTPDEHGHLGFIGYGPAVVEYDAGLGFIFEQGE